MRCVQFHSEPYGDTGAYGESINAGDVQVLVLPDEIAEVVDLDHASTRGASEVVLTAAAGHAVDQRHLSSDDIAEVVKKLPVGIADRGR